MERRLFHKADLLLILLVALVALAALWLARAGQDGAVTADIYVDGALWRTVVLDDVTQPATLTLDTDPPAVIELEPGRIRYRSADCPDHLCVAAGWLSRAGDTAACLPGRSLIRLRAGRETVYLTH